MGFRKKPSQAVRAQDGWWKVSGEIHMDLPGVGYDTGTVRF